MTRYEILYRFRLVLLGAIVSAVFVGSALLLERHHTTQVAHQLERRITDLCQALEAHPSLVLKAHSGTCSQRP